MTVFQIITEHLGGGWWLQRWDTSTLSVLLDRLMEVKNCDLKMAIWFVVWQAEGEMSAIKLLPNDWVSTGDRQRVRQLVGDGDLKTAYEEAFKYRIHKGWWMWACLITDLLRTVESAGLTVTTQ